MASRAAATLSMATWWKLPLKMCSPSSTIGIRLPRPRSSSAETASGLSSSPSNIMARESRPSSARSRSTAPSVWSIMTT